MKFYGITRIRNEQVTIKNTLDHVARFVDGVYVYDDCSTDNTVEICKGHSIVKGIIRGIKWDSTTEGRRRAEGDLRQRVYREAVKNGADWVYYFDADEYAELENVDFRVNGYFLRLFDYYITPEDVDTPYLQRKWMGPEYRDIPMIFKVDSTLNFTQRVPRNYGVGKFSDRFKKVAFGGYVKHYGKAMSIEEWERKCHYYADIRWKGLQPHLRQRWIERKGKAIHTISDFGRPLITWDERKDESKIISII